MTAALDRRVGANNPNNKLQPHQVMAIYISGEKLEYLALLYNVSTTTVHKIKRGRIWSHITRFLVEERYSSRRERP